MEGKFEYTEGDTVRIKTGPFALFVGKVIEVEHEKATLKVIIRFHNEPKILQLGFLDVEKAPAL